MNFRRTVGVFSGLLLGVLLSFVLMKSSLSSTDIIHPGVEQTFGNFSLFILASVPFVFLGLFISFKYWAYVLLSAATVMLILFLPFVYELLLDVLSRTGILSVLANLLF